MLVNEVMSDVNLKLTSRGFGGSNMKAMLAAILGETLT